MARWFKLGPIFDRGGCKAAGATAPESKREYERDNERRERIVRAFERCLADGKSLTEIRDASELPYPKMVILAALAQEIRASEDDDRVCHLKVMAGFLADYQDEVGSRPLTLMGISDDEFRSLLYDTGDSFPDPLRMIERNPERERYQSLRAISDQELRYINLHLRTADESRVRPEQAVA